jgi:hypothetical protein
VIGLQVVEYFGMKLHIILIINILKLLHGKGEIKKNLNLRIFGMGVQEML